MYQLLVFFLSPLILGQITWLSFRNRQTRYLMQRTGFGYSQLPSHCLWFHCASVGEINTLLPLLKNLHKNDQQLKMIVTSNTITGAELLQQQNIDYLTHSYLPFDWPLAVNRFLHVVKPTSLFVMETEIWPTLFKHCHGRNIPVKIINARLSHKTTSANNWVKSLLKYSLSKVSKIYARSTANTQSYIQLGAKKNTIETIGNLKFTTAIKTQDPQCSTDMLNGRDYLLIASTHHDEEQQLYNIWQRLNRKELLVIAPRHPERSAAITRQLNSQHIAVRSKKQLVTEQTDIFLLDTIGELKNLFKDAKLVIMGGSFSKIGGHNILEPASYNQAIITGPHMENFREELDLMLSCNAIIQVHSYTELQQQLQALLNEPQLRETLKKNTATITHNVEKILNDYTRFILAD